ncbi:MAG: proline/glycine betaine ABC transporter permease [Chloroflexaceae bacterium]|nr:proline/glycine betaine ABC transporter permease [Chloroflexaceae bacterium]
MMPLGEWIGNGVEAAVEWLTINLSWLFDAISWPIAFVLENSVAVLQFLPWPVVILAVVAIGWHRGGWQVALISGIGLLFTGFLGYWELTMRTLGMVITALSFSVVIGIPLGILAARYDSFEGFIRPVLDAMQTIHPFVYLVPIVMLFGIGPVPGTLATIVFALPPMVRLTNLGIRQVPGDVVEAGKSFGSDDWQLLFEVQIPLATPTIMAGLNQTLMLALSMVVIVALIAGGGLGQEILRAVGRLEIGRAVASGLAVLVLAIVLDRISQATRKAPSAH